MNRVRKMLLKEEVDPAAVDNSYISGDLYFSIFGSEAHNYIIL